MTTLSLTLYQGTTSECLKGLADGKFDVVFCGKTDRFDDIEFVPQFSQNVVLAVNSYNALADREMVSLNDLKGITLTSYRSQSYAHTIFEGFFQRYGLDVKQGFNDEISAATLVSSDRNIAAIILETLDDLSLRICVTIRYRGAARAVPYHLSWLQQEVIPFAFG